VGLAIIALGAAAVSLFLRRDSRQVVEAGEAIPENAISLEKEL
jgi:hypothetical protein